jgi:hypothetical protein
MGVGLFTGVKLPGRGANHPPLPVFKVKGKVQLYMIHLYLLQDILFDTVLLRAPSGYRQCSNGALTVTHDLPYFKQILSLPFYIFILFCHFNNCIVVWSLSPVFLP